MEQRCYFLAGDILSNALMGMAAAWMAALIVAPGWYMLAGMAAGMAAGMGLALLLLPLFVGLFGAMEVMLPVMLSAMLAGMLAGMAAAAQALSVPETLLGGGACGLLVLLLTYAADAGVRARSR
ncbi:MAG: hypothetical protein PVJ66_07240 [Gammaproteobacteria bacterium]|jgi:hypothetical protein